MGNTCCNTNNDLEVGKKMRTYKLMAVKGIASEISTVDGDLILLHNVFKDKSKRFV